MIYLLKNIYEDWKEMKVEIKELAYDIIRNERHILLKQMLLRLLFRNKTIKGRFFLIYSEKHPYLSIINSSKIASLLVLALSKTLFLLKYYSASN